MHQDARGRTGALLTTLLTTALVLTAAGCAPPDRTTHERDRPRASPTAHRANPRTTDVFPGGTAVSAVQFWHDNSEIMPQVLDGATLLLDAAGAGASTVTVPTTSPEESLVLVLTCARPAGYTLSVAHESSADTLASTSGDSCGGPTITVFPTPPLDFSLVPTTIDVDVPDDTAYYLAVYRTPRAAATP